MECGEGFDRSNLDLAGVQVDLLKEIYATGTPMIVILIQGRPYSINWIAEHAPAVINAWYPGQEGGTAIADILFGDYNPAGRLSVSIPKSAGQLPVYYNRKPSAAGGYVFCDSKPIYSFGYGLSYTTFAYSNLTVSPQRISPGQPATVNVDVTNTGDRAGDEVVQMYIRDEVSSVTRPIKELKGFLRIHLRPSETKTVTLEILPEHLSLLDTAMRRLIEPGEFTIMVGGNQDDVLSARLTVSDR